MDRGGAAPLTPTTPVEQLGEAIAELTSRLHAATYELLVMLLQFDAQNGWNTGFMSCAHWLSWRTGIDMGAAREKVRVAKALPALPRLSGALRRGVTSSPTAAQVERVARAWRRCDRLEEAREDRQRRLSRSVTTSVDEDGMVRWAGWRSVRFRQTSIAALPETATNVLELEDGGLRVSAETSRRLSCDASLAVMREGPDGTVLDVGRRTRTVPTPIRRALTARDSRCRFPGCTAPRCDAHHITHGADGGSTSLHNLMLLCRRHHTLLHEGGALPSNATY